MDDLRQVTVYKDNFAINFPEIVSLSHTQNAANSIAENNLHAMNELKKKGVFSDQDMEEMFRAEHAIFKKIANFKPETLWDGEISIQTRFPV